MPIRLVDDEPEEDQPQDDGGRDNSGGGGGGGFPGGGMLSMLLPLLFRYPKLLILAVVLYGLYYMTSGGCSTPASASEGLSTGMEMKQEVFDKAPVFEPLSADMNGKLPESVSLEAYCPKRGNQGGQGSCVGWASAYAARTILQAQATAQNPNSTIFSPAYVYNQIHLDNCQGSYMNEALKCLGQKGALPLAEFPYNDRDCSKQPSAAQKDAGAQYRIGGFNRLTDGDNTYGLDINAMKQNLAQGCPVLIGAMVTSSFQEMRGNRALWRPSSYDQTLGGHAMCVIGYDDTYAGGAFQIMNSWGEDWGDRGFGWVRYADFKEITKEAYGLHPLAKPATDGKFDVKIGLVQNKTKQHIPITLKSSNLFTSAKVGKGTPFKVEVNNSVECYTYVFGMESDNTSYVLFPYSPKYSAYCGIVGSRLFPKGKSLQPDEVGTQDYMAIVVSKKELNYAELNAKVSAAKGTDYLAKFKAALGSKMAQSVSFKAENGVMHFTATDKDDDAVVVTVVEVNK